MAIDIDGFIEVRPWATWPDLPSEIPWEAAARLDCLNVTPDYDAFGCLFGVMNFAGFRPVAADRGPPPTPATPCAGRTGGPPLRALDDVGRLVGDPRGRLGRARRARRRAAARVPPR